MYLFKGAWTFLMKKMRRQQKEKVLQWNVEKSCLSSGGRGACKNLTLHVWWTYRNCVIHLVNICLILDCILSQNCRNTVLLRIVDQLSCHAKMRGWCGWQGWNVWKFKPIARLNIWLHNVVKRGFMCSKQSWK